MPPILRPLLALLAAATLLAAPVHGQDLFSHFQFKDLKFQFWPEGLEDDADREGSAITVHVTRVEVKDLDAVEFRHCIDSDMSFCSYNLPPTGDQDGTVERDEVADFRNIVQVGLQGYVPKVREFTDTLRHNITIDGQKATLVNIYNVAITGAEGDTDSNATILVDLDAKALYKNDYKAAKHVVKIGNMTLRPGFSYTNAIWAAGDASWSFDPTSTKPESAKSVVNQHGLFTAQTSYESLGEKGLELTLVKGASKGKSPGLEVPLLVAVLVGLALVRRRP
ncbi:MAG TPA: hypothetical protein VI818_01820 [Candidatus Thermoplasmatota archaeon]|nr:hypothetical protein [Candidatus Thermoplasmatota archaeon]